MQRARIAIGLIGWITLIVWLSGWFRSYMLEPQADGHQVAADLWDFATARRRVVRMKLARNWPLQVGDPIYMITGPEAIQQVGEVRSVRAPEKGEGAADGSRIAEALLYPAARRDRYSDFADVF